MKGKLPVILAIMLALALPIVTAAAGEQTTEREVDQARRVAQDWVNRIAITDPEVSGWQGAHVTSPQPYHNPDGEVIAYMFAIEKKGKMVGRVLVGSATYGFPIFEAGKAPPFSIPPAGEVSRILREDHGLQIVDETLGEPRLLLLNILRGFYVIWELEGKLAGINLITGDSFVLPRLDMLKSTMPFPLEYQAAKRATSQSLPEGLSSGQGWIRNPHAMVAWGELAVPLYPDRLWCGPASGVSIAMWQRNADGDTSLGDPPLQMFKEIRTHMGTTRCMVP